MIEAPCHPHAHSHAYACSSRARVCAALRAAHDAILVGVGTVLSDDPQLTVRLAPGRSPLRVVLDSHLRVSPDARALRGAHSPPSGASSSTMMPATADEAPSGPPPAAHLRSASPAELATAPTVVTLQSTLQSAAHAAKLDDLRARGVRVIGVRAEASGHVCLGSALRALRSQLGIGSVMIEGGAAVIGSCARELLAHRVIVTLAPKTSVNGLRPGTAAASPSAPLPEMVPSAASSAGSASCLRRVEAFCLGDDVVVSGEGPAARGPSPLPLSSRL